MTSNLPKKGEFFELRPDARRRGKGHGVVFENESSLKTPPNFLLRPDQGGFPPLRETPRLVYYPSEGWPPAISPWMSKLPAKEAAHRYSIPFTCSRGSLATA